MHENANIAFQVSLIKSQLAIGKIKLEFCILFSVTVGVVNNTLLLISGRELMVPTQQHRMYVITIQIQVKGPVAHA